MTIRRWPRRGRGSGSDQGVVALEFALHLPLLALVVVGVLSLVGLVRTGLVVQEAARVGARLAAVGGDPATVASAVGDIAGPDATVSTSMAGPGDVVVVEVRTRWSALGLAHDVAGHGAAMVEPVVGS